MNGKVGLFSRYPIRHNPRDAKCEGKVQRNREGRLERRILEIKEQNRMLQID